MKRLLSILILALLCVLSSGCVYFNVFFNAKRRFEEAEKYRLKAQEMNDQNAMRTAGDIYTQAIFKAYAVIELHPGSKWVDDSLMLIGKAQYWQEHYQEALKVFADLRSNFPKSVLLEESRLWEGRAYAKLGLIADAQRVLRALALEGRSTHADQAAFALVEIDAGQKDYKLVASEGQELLGRLRTSNLRAGIHQQIGAAQVALKDYSGAEASFRGVLKNAPTPRQEYEARTALGGILEARGEFEKARDWYEKMLRVKSIKQRFGADIRLNLAGALYRLGRDEEAYRLCKGVTEAYSHTASSASAYYRMGLIAQRERRKSEEVKELLRKAQQEYRESPVYDLARQRQGDLDDLDRYTGQIAADSTGVRSLEAQFDLAELYRLRLEEPDSALAAYRRVAARDTSKTLAPKAAYAIGWIYAEMKQDSVAARETFTSLAKDYPGTPYAEAAAAWIGGDAAQNDAMKRLYQQAESLRFSGSDPKAYLPILEKIVADDPRGVYAGRALYVAAWTYENALKDGQAARRRYQEVAERFANLDVGDLARRKVEAMFAEAREDSLRLVARADSLKKAAVEDSLRRTAGTDSLKKAAVEDSLRRTAGADSLRASARPDSAQKIGPRPEAQQAAVDSAQAVQLPKVAQAAPLVYPDSLKQYPTEATVYLSVRVGMDGRVKEAFATRGPERYYEAAIATVKQYTFLPGLRAGQPMEMWVEQIVNFLPP